MNIREALEKANKQLMAKIDDAMTKEVFEEVQDEEAATIYSGILSEGTKGLGEGGILQGLLNSRKA